LSFASAYAQAGFVIRGTGPTGRGWGKVLVLATKIRWIERMVGAVVIARRYRHKIRLASKQFPIVDDPELNAAIRKRFNGYSFDLWHKVYAAASGRTSVDYLPEDLFYNVFENRLNPRHRKATYADKNHYDRLGWSCLPQTIFRIINGRLFDRTYRMIDTDTALAVARGTELSEFVVKPTRETGRGSRVMFLDFSSLAAFLPANMKHHSDWIIQYPIIQHEVMAGLNASSVNTIRIITIRMGAVVSIVSSFATIGTRRLRADNRAGICASVEEDGRLGKDGYDDNLQRYTTHPDHGYAFDSFVIPSFSAAQQTCIGLHQTIPELDLISWDVAIAHNGAPVVTEFNIRRQDINTSQVCSGPVLKPYIDQVLGRAGWLVIPGIGAIDRQVDIPHAADDN
jgi:hypothetical protein